LSRTWLSISIVVILVIAIIGLVAPVIIASDGGRSSNEIIFATSDNLISKAMILDSEDNVIVVGGRANSNSDDSNEFFIVKFSPNGETLWYKNWNKTGNDFLTDCKVDSLDNIIVTGVSNTFEENTSATIYKLDSSGEIIWDVEILGLNYGYFGSTFLGVQIDKSIDNIFIVGALSGLHYRTLVMQLNSSGSVLWSQEWKQIDGSIPYSFWISSQKYVMITGGTYDYGLSEYDPRAAYVAAFNFNGTELWNQTDFNWFYGLEVDNSSFVAVSDLGIGRLEKYDYSLNELWDLEFNAEGPYFETITHLTLNGTDGIVGCGTVQHQQAAYVTKAFHPSFSPAPRPQTLVFSCTTEGEIEWYDFLIQGLISEPCGCAINSQGELVIAGHMNDGDYMNDLYVVFGFRYTPFSADMTPAIILLVPGFTIMAVAIFHKLGKRIGVSLRDSVKSMILIELILLALMYLQVLNPIGAPITVFWAPWVIAVFGGLHFAIGVLILIFLVLKLKSS